MADVPVGAVPAPVSPAVPVKPANPVVVAQAARAEKLAKVSAGLSKLGGENTPAPTAPKVDVLPSERAPEAPKAPELEAKPDPKVDPEKPDEVEAKPEAKSDDEPDPKTAKALAAIDKQAKRFREEQAVAKREFEQEMAQQRADFARERSEFQAQRKSIEDLRARAKRDPIGHLREMGLETEDEWETVGRGAFPHTKAGKSDPRSAAVAAQSLKEREILERVAAAEARAEAIEKSLTETQQRAEAKRHVDEWTSGAVKAIPTTPTLIGKLHAKSPEKAKQVLLDIGARLERENDGETPSHADVIAEYERARRAELEETGVDVDALLKPAAETPAKKPVATRTLDVGAPTGGVRPINDSPSRAEKLANVSAGLRKLHAENT